MPPKKNNNPSLNKVSNKTITVGNVQGELVFNGGYLGLKGDLVERCLDNFQDQINEHCPSEYKKKKDDRDKTSHHHITLMLKQDIKKATESLKDSYPSLLPADISAENVTVQHLLDAMAKEIDFSEITALGVGKQKKAANETVYIVVEWPSASHFLKNVNADTRDFHITLGFKDTDIHGVAKNRMTLVKKSE